MDLRSEAKEMAKQAKEVSRLLARLSTDTKNKALFEMADDLEKNQAFLIEENKKDLSAGEQAHLSSAMMDRLRMTPDAAGLCLKSGNAIILRGGSEAFHSNQAIVHILQKALNKADVPEEAVQIFSRTDREAIQEMLQLEEEMDLILPRGGEALIRFVATHSKIPVIKHYKGVCHIFVDETADPEMALRICLNAKVQRPGVCNAMETLLVHERIAGGFLPTIAETLRKG